MLPLVLAADPDRAYIEYGNLLVPHATETDLPMLHPYGNVAVVSRYATDEARTRAIGEQHA
jgi:hypothetical protein